MLQILFAKKAHSQQHEKKASNPGIEPGSSV